MKSTISSAMRSRSDRLPGLCAGTPATPGSQATTLSPSRPVDLDHDPGRGGLPPHELERDARPRFREQSRSLADDDREPEERELVDEAGLDQRSEQRAAGVDLELAARLRLQLANGTFNVVR